MTRPCEEPGEAVTRLTGRRKADRATMAARVAELAAGHGIAARVASGEHQRPRAMLVDLEGPHGLRLTVAFNGDSPRSEPDTYVLSWHGVADGWQLSASDFAHVNPYHGHKATDVAHGFTDLYCLLSQRFMAIANGTAFIPAVQEGATAPAEGEDRP